jgi:hypothetical protein
MDLDFFDLWGRFLQISGGIPELFAANRFSHAILW